MGVLKVAADSEEVTPENSKTVDLSTLKPKYNTRSKSSIKHVLTEYGMHDVCGDDNLKDNNKTMALKVVMFLDILILYNIIYLYVLCSLLFFVMLQ